MDGWNETSDKLSLTRDKSSIFSPLLLLYTLSRLLRSLTKPIDLLNQHDCPFYINFLDMLAKLNERNE